MEGIVGLSAKERARFVELSMVKAGRQTLKAASERLGMSRRQMGRSFKRFRQSGAKGLVHAGRGRGSNRAFETDARSRSLEMYPGAAIGVRAYAGD